MNRKRIKNKISLPVFSKTVITYLTNAVKHKSTKMHGKNMLELEYRGNRGECHPHIQKNCTL